MRFDDENQKPKRNQLEQICLEDQSLQSAGWDVFLLKQENVRDSTNHVISFYIML